MKFVNIHLGNTQIPEYLKVCLRQIEKYSGNKPTLIVDSNHNNLNEYKNLCNVVDFRDCNINLRQTNIFLQDPTSFWELTAKRIFVLNEYLSITKDENVIHLENDILIYENPDKYQTTFDELFSDKVAINPIGPRYSTFCYVYIKNHTVLNNLCNKFKNLLLLGRNNLSSLTEGEFLSEMTILNILIKQNDSTVGGLPILPSSKYFDKFNSLFDGASWGQFLGGTPNDKTPRKLRESHHFVGVELLNNKYDVQWIEEKPYVIELETGRNILLNNLHVHSKELEKFVF